MFCLLPLGIWKVSSQEPLQQYCCENVILVHHLLKSHRLIPFKQCYSCNDSLTSRTKNNSHEEIAKLVAQWQLLAHYFSNWVVHLYWVIKQRFIINILRTAIEQKIQKTLQIIRTGSVAQTFVSVIHSYVCNIFYKLYII